ncbi:3' terminal RNA ribose 2'-O-methyltransferase Hen1 [Actinoplanes lobatus]|uniref:Small RNA 2'-O-methyltransferase n=1 Tax=Actinoplanes lobatus TaxID=113568 RepID=A0A7W7HDB0_9ACTN|nr:3' terminal RNA ribose 2'-O-methyltransferase Hen1 [Actinoplanes lobatus]MBB4748012.1 3' terminal RNA ribose 2'-O-methyltransferase Hen1 [Actinoplanes lobatus]GGN80809.1 3' terminal RNA ribose 2'-O-methyltransferase Hen1 [Actinoplanes lobatus]GIE41521.1 3' terminal RNA ribose 2'-O-methyltransferase Hen1 [Actinoplanes lobatus]
MLLTLTTTHRPATDLGYLLVKHPGKVHSFDVPTGTAHVLYPEAEEDRCTAALLLDIDPQRLRAQRDAFELSQYVNDRPYAASSLLASALAKVFRSALRGASRDRPELAATSIPLEIHVPVLRGTPELVSRLFTPLGWQVTATPIPFEAEIGGDSRYVDVHLSGELRVADALNHLYVLLPVLDDGKHYWVAPDEIEKLLRSGEGWLAAHPEKVLIARRYLAHRRSLATTALELLEADQPATEEEAELPVARRAPLAEQRREAVLAALTEVGASRVLDLGCGGGALLTALVKDRGLTEIVGADVSTRSLEQAARRLRLDRLPERQKDRIRLIQTALTYRDDRLRGFDAAVLMEVIEHIDLPRLPALEAAVFGHARPGAVIVTTPNVEYNVHYEGLSGMRHSDHRFEWTRAEFAAWAESVAAAHGYTVTIRGVGEADEVTGAPTQLALFKISEVTA